MRILVIQTAFLGDLILTLPLVRRLHEADPSAAITLAVRPCLVELVSRQPGIAAVLPVRKRRGFLSRLGHDRGVLGRLRRGRFDTVYLAHRSFRSGLYARLSGAARRVGFAGSPSSWACNERVPYDREKQAADRILALAAAPSSGPAIPHYEIDETARAAGDAVLRAQGVDPTTDFVTLAPGSIWPTKRWNVAGYAGILHWAAERGFRPVLIGSQDERALCERLTVVSAGRAVNLAGRTSLTALAAILGRSRLMIGNDSGPGHLAAAVGTPVVTIFGPTTPEFGFRPAGSRVLSVGRETGLDCRPCSRHGALRCPLGHHRCMQDLTSDAVIERIENWDFNPLRDTLRALRG